MGSPIGTPPDHFWGANMSDEHHSSSGIHSSAEASAPGSAGGRPREKKRVGFTGGSDPAIRSPRMSWDGPSSDYDTPDPSSHSRSGSRDVLVPEDNSRSHLPELSQQQTREIYQAFEHTVSLPRPRPVIRRAGSSHVVRAEEDVDGPDEDGSKAYRRMRAQEAFERGRRLELDERSAPNSRHSSPQHRAINDRLLDEIELNEIEEKIYEDKEEMDDAKHHSIPGLDQTRLAADHEAQRLVRKHTTAHGVFNHSNASTASGFRSGAVTPTEEQEYAHDYRAPPEHYRNGILGTLLKLYNQPSENHDSHTRSSSLASLLHRRPQSGDWTSAASTPQHSPPGSGSSTPTGDGWKPHLFTKKHKNHSTSSLAQLVGSSASLGSPAVSGYAENVSHKLKEQKEQEERHRAERRAKSAGALAKLNRVARSRLEDEIKIKIHIAETVARQQYLMRLCKALMMYGAPTHRLEEYMRMSARVLEIEAQFLYIPGSMIVSFDDRSTHTTEVKLVKTTQGLDLGKLRDTHDVYKEVVHDRIGVEEATQRLRETMGKRPKHSRWVRIPVYGLAAVCVGPYAFSARLIDLPIAFILGCILGILQLVVAPASDLYANVFEISAAVITSFLARAFGSIPYKGGRLFCFSALAQSSIALILPGYIVLCASLELQSRNIVAGSIRMVYAIIYSLFLGFGITIGTSIYGIIDVNASSSTTCSDPIPGEWIFFFVPAFALCLAIVNQAKWKQTPAMVVIAFGGYVVNYYTSRRFAGNTQVSSTLGALAIGVMANFYSRVGSRVENWALDVWEDKLRPHWKRIRKTVVRGPKNGSRRATRNLEEGVGTGDDDSVFVRSTRRVGYSLAATAMLPAIFVQVPSGLSVGGSLVAGIASADQIAGNATNGSTVVNTTTISGDANALNSIAFNVGYSVIQVAIGITVGLFLSAIVVYPLGKRRSGLFSF